MWLSSQVSNVVMEFNAPENIHINHINNIDIFDIIRH